MEGIENFHKRLIETIKKRGMSIKYVSRQIEMPNTTLFSWTTGAIPKDPETLRELANFLDVDFYYLLFGTSDPNKRIEIQSSEEPGEYRFILEVRKID